MASKNAEEQVSSGHDFPSTAKPVGFEKEVPITHPDDIKKAVASATKEFQDQLFRTDEALYEGLSKVYHFYLLANSNIRPHTDALNALVREKTGKADFDILKEPEKNRFGNLIRATLLHIEKRDGRNEPDLHIPETTSTWSAALHYGLRKQWTPDELLAHFANKGVRYYYDEELKERRGENGDGIPIIDPEELAQIAIDTAQQLPKLGDSVTVSTVIPSATKLGLFLGRVEPKAGGGFEVVLLSQLPRDDEDLKAEAIGLLDQSRLDASVAGPLVQLVRLGASFLGNVSKCRVLIRVRGGVPTALITLPGRSIKSTSHVVATFSAPVDQLASDADYVIDGDKLINIMSLSTKMPLAELWRFEEETDRDAQKAKIERKNHFLVVNTPDGPKRWQLGSGSRAEVPEQKLWETVPGKRIVAVDRAQWQRVVKFTGTKVSPGEGEGEGHAAGYELRLRQHKLYVSALGTKESHTIDISVVDGGKSEARFELKHNMISRLTRLLETAGDGRLSIAIDDQSVVVEVRGRRATFSTHINNQPVIKPKLEKAKPVKGRGRKAQ